MATTGTYFVSRSHDSNALNLLGTWLPLLVALVLVARVRGLHAWSRTLAAVATPLVLVAAVVVLGSGAPWRQRLATLAEPPAGSVEAVLPVGSMQLAQVRRGLARVRGRPFVNLTTRQPTLSVGAPAYEPWLPAYPWEEFVILSPERQAEILDRFARRALPDDGWLLRHDGERTRQAAIQAFLDREFELAGTAALGDGLRLEHWRRRGARARADG
jgi:hypothetical protein